MLAELAGWLAIVPVAGALAAWSIRQGERFWLLIFVVPLLPYTVGVSVPVLAMAIGLRRRALAIAAGLLIVAQAVALAPTLPIHHGRPPRGRSFTVASLNLLFSNTEVERAGRQLLAADPDVLALQEYTPEAMAIFTRIGLLAAYEYRLEAPLPGVAGEAIYSHLPLRSTTQRLLGSNVPVGVLTTPDGRTVHLLDLHTRAPTLGNGAMARGDVADVGRSLDQLPQPWIAVGDFNVTPYHRPYRDLLAGGRHDAHLMTGRGYARTWQADASYPPLALIDHAILSPGVGATHTAEQTIAGSDHRMIIATVVVAAPA